LNGADTNVVLRYLIDDDVDQHRTVIKLFSSRSPETPIRISNIVLVEITWVLRTVYRQTESNIIEGLAILLAIPAFVIDGRASVQSVVDRRIPLSMLADAFIAESNHDAGCESTFTFDQKAAAAIPAMELMP
jgi:predicted nucleic-acid-binding protein